MLYQKFNNDLKHVALLVLQELRLFKKLCVYDSSGYEREVYSVRPSSFFSCLKFRNILLTRSEKVAFVTISKSYLNVNILITKILKLTHMFSLSLYTTSAISLVPSVIPGAMTRSLVFLLVYTTMKSL